MEWSKQTPELGRLIDTQVSKTVGFHAPTCKIYVPFPPQFTRFYYMYYNAPSFLEQGLAYITLTGLELTV